MTGEGGLERRYRRLLAWYPAGHRGTYGEEMIGVLLAATPGGSSRPGLAGAFDLIRGGLRARFRSGVRWLAHTDWPDALAVCSVAVPVILLGYFTADWLYSLGTALLHGYTSPWSGQAERGLIVLAIAAPPLLALRWRRKAAVLALALAGWYLIIVFGSLPGSIPHLGQWPWLVNGEGISSLLALLLGAAALAWSPGPRRGIVILTPRSWLVLTGPGVAMGLTQPYLWAQPLWLVAVIVIAALAVVAAGLVLTIPGPAARGLLLLAAPAYPGAVWGIGFSRIYTNHVSGFPLQAPLRAHRAVRLPGRGRHLAISPPQRGVRLRWRHRQPVDVPTLTQKPENTVP
jgi:hypothetical protein